MVRLIAITVVLIGVGFAYEEYTSKSIGVKRTITGVLDMLGGNNGISTGLASPAHGES